MEGVAGVETSDGCSESIVFTFTVTDDCGNTATSTTMVTRIFDETAPVIVPVADFQLDGCDQPWPTTLSTTWSDNCSEGGVVEGVAGVETSDGCSESIVFTFTVMDDCGNTASSTTVITRIFDETAPTIINPTDYVLPGCNPDWPAEVLATWTDNCSAGGEIVGVVSDSLTEDCSQSRTYTFSIMDDCGNEAFASTIITRIIDEANPDIVPIADFQIMECNADWPVLITAWTSSCSSGGNVMGVAGDITTTGCIQSRIYTFTVNDDCGTSTSATTMVTRVFDNAAPIIETVADFQLDGCNQPWPTTLTTTWSDNCSDGGEVVGVTDDDILTEGCLQSRTYTFTVMDDCGNTASLTTVVTRIFDETAPTIINPADYVLPGCEPEWPIEVLATWTDNCSAGGEIVGVVSDSITEVCSQSRTYTFSITDECGNEAFASTIITRIIDEANPDIVPIDNIELLECNAEWPVLVTTWTSGCSSGGNIMGVAGDITTIECLQSRVYTFTVNDDCGTSTSSTTLVTRVFDDTAPTIINPADYVLPGCSPEWPSEVLATWIGNCTGGGEIAGVVSDSLTEECSQSRTYTFSVVDDCGNDAFASTIITRIIDEANPVIVPIEDFELLECNADWPVLVTSWTSGCSSGGNVMGIAGEITTSGCLQSRVYTFTVNDDCGISTSATTLVTRVFDDTAPTINNPPDYMLSGCEPEWPSQVLATWTDNCSGGGEIVGEAGDIIDEDCLQRRTYTFSIMDECGNEAFASTIVSRLLEETTPEITLLADFQLELCNAPWPEFLSTTWSDNCTGGGIVEGLPGEITTIDCIQTRPYTFNVTSECGEFAQAVVLVSRIIDDGPVFENIEAEITVACIDDIPEFNPTVYSECFGDSVAYPVLVFEGGGNPEAICVLTTAIGAGADWALWLPSHFSNGFSASANFVFDANGGMFDQFENGTAHLYGTVVNDINPDESYILDFWFENKRDWTEWSALGRSYKDDAGFASSDNLWTTWSYYELVNNISTATGTGDLEGNILYFQHMPDSYLFGFQVGDAANNKNANYGMSGWFTYTGIVDGVMTNGYGDVNVDADCPILNIAVCIDQLVYTYTYMTIDECLNSARFTQTIIVNDTIGPSFVNFPADTTISCEDWPLTVPQVEAVDNCEGDVVLSDVTTEIIDGNCPNSFVVTYTWTATDLCDNQTIAVWTVSVVDNTAPVITACPSDANYTCLSDVPAADSTLIVATDVCSDVTTITLFSEVTNGDECAGTIVRTYHATDECGNFSECVQVITYNDTIPPVLDNMPANMMASCENIPDISDVTATDNCGDAEVVITVKETLFSGGCIGVIQRIYTATDACGNTATHEQFITLVDTIAPVLANLPLNAVYECHEAVPAPANVTATDNCDDNVIVNYSQSIVDGDCVNEHTILRTWTATDICDNSVTYTQVINIVDTSVPTFNVSDTTITVACDVDYVVTTPLAFDNCDNSPTVTVVSSSTPGDCANEYTEVHVWTATDTCGNTSSVSLTIHYVDTIAPVFTLVPAAISVECGATIPVTTAEASDNCGDVTITYSDSELLDDACAGYYLRTFTAVDACGNTSTATQTINIIDSTVPVITACPADANYACLSAVPAADSTLIVATDVCSDVTITLFSEVTNGDECAGTIVRTYRATDECGNFSECVQVISYNDTIPPVFDNIPANMRVSCENVPDISDVTATDNCDTSVVISVKETLFSGGCIGVIQRIYTATDACGNSTSFEHYITLVDTIAPVLANLPLNAVYECHEAVPAPANVTATDNCDQTVMVNYSQSIVDGDCVNEHTILRTWTATDICGNSVSYTQVITIVDTTSPTFNISDTTITVACDDDYEVTAPSAFDNCDNNPTVTVVSSSTPGECANEYTEVHVWTATDTCGNTASVSLTIHYVDTIAPVFTLVPTAISVECGAAIPVTTAEASDNCGDVTITYSDSELLDDACAGYYLRTFTAVDACGNSSTVTQTINIIDTTVPLITACPADANYVCLSDVPAADSTLIVATDVCSDVTITLFSEVTNGDECSGTIVRTYRATDECGNFSECVQVISYNDTIAPVFDNPPANMRVSCENIPAFSDVTATDNCDTSVVISVQETLFSGGCIGVIQRIYTATDACGNTATHEQFITLVDTIAPVLANLPVNAVYECHEAVPAPANVTATDNCDENVMVNYSQSIVDGDCVNEHTILRTWTATDICGNSVSYIQVITIVDTTSPTFNISDTTITVACDDDYEVTAPSAFDNCDNNPTVTVVSSSTPGECANEYTEVHVWTATDTCGNTASVSLTIHYVDTIAPVFTLVPAAISVECGAAIPVTTAEANDNCGDVTITYSDSELLDDACAGHYLRTFTAVDACGNSSTATQAINIIDTTVPVFSQSIADVVVECAEDAPDYAVATATDNCGSVNIEMNTTILSSDDCGNYVELATYVATDDCGNSATQSYTITVEDLTGPVLSDTPDDLEIDCLEPLPAPPAITAFDNCQGEVDVTYTEQFFGDVPTPGSISDCNLVDAPNTSPSWGLWLQDLPEGYNYYVTVNAKFVEFPDGTAHLSGTVVSETNPNAGWIIDVWYMDGLDWNDWSNQSFATGIKNDAGLAGDNFLDWTFYITNATSSILTGTGDLAGSSLNLSHAPESLFFGFQVGIAANNFSEGHGMGGWFHYEGNFQNTLIPIYEDGAQVTGVGDFAFEGDCCPIYNVDRTWTATDCSGNTTLWMQNISFIESPENPGLVDPGSFAIDMKGSSIAITNVYPNPSKEIAIVEFVSTRSSRVSLNVYNFLGNIVAQIFVGDVEAGVVNTVEFNVHEMHNGMYYVRMSSGSESVAQKFVKH